MGGEAIALVAPEDYLAAEKGSTIRHEYLGGAVHAMTGAGVRHNHIATSALLNLGSQLRGKPCFPIGSDTKIKIETNDQTRFYYPDAGVVCESGPEDQHYQEKPVLIIEVLSDSTRRIDQGEKKDAYLQIPSLQAYLLIETEKPEVTVYQSEGEKFVASLFTKLEDIITLSTFDLTLPLNELYERVEFP